MTKDRFAATMGLIDDLTKERVLVGVPGETTDRRPEPGEAAPPNNATIAWIMENGSPARNIPARPSIVPGVENARERIADIYEDAARATLAGRTVTADVAHHAVGLTAQASIRQKITDGPFAPLSPKTLTKRRARGVTRTDPLKDTLQFRNSINYVVRPTDRQDA